jgi:ribonucleoside-diphosphate reductase alpha chain
MSRPRIVRGTTTELATGCGSLYLTESLPTEEYKETFCRLGKSGGCASAFLDGIGRLITFALLAGVSKETIIRAFQGIQCPSPTVSDGVKVLSCIDAIATLLKEEPSCGIS